MDTQNERFERYNEITFEAYCKAAIDPLVPRPGAQMSHIKE